MNDVQTSQICGFAGPMFNPPDLGPALRLPVDTGAVDWPDDPSTAIPRLQTVSAGTRQSTSMSCEPASVCGLPAECGCGTG